MALDTSAINFGTCWGTPLGQDISTPSYMAQGLRCVAEAILRRWTTSQGQLIDDPNYGYNLLDLVSDDLTAAQLSYAQQQAAAEAEQDERVRSATVTLSLDATGTVNVSAQIVTAAGPFPLVFSLTSSGLTLSQETRLLLVSP